MSALSMRISFDALPITEHIHEIVLLLERKRVPHRLLSEITDCIEASDDAVCYNDLGNHIEILPSPRLCAVLGNLRACENV